MTKKELIERLRELVKEYPNKPFKHAHILEDSDSIFIDTSIKRNTLGRDLLNALEHSDKKQNDKIYLEIETFYWVEIIGVEIDDEYGYLYLETK